MTELLGEQRPLTEQACHFGLCRRPVEFEVVVSPDVVPVLVCGLHVTPVVTWGTVPTSKPTIHHLGSRPETAA